MVGPCLCGDPYCGSCGDPQAAALDELLDQVVSELEKLDPVEIDLFLAAGRHAVASLQAAQKRYREMQMEAYAP